MKRIIPRIIMTMGEPAGIGPELLVKIAQLKFEAEIVVLANDDLLKQIASELSLPLSLIPVDYSQPPSCHKPGNLKFENIVLPSKPVAGELNIDNSNAVLESLNRAGELALTNQVDGIVTAPVHKSILHQFDDHFLGHTEFFAKQAKVEKVVMMLATKQLRMALVTTHIPVSQVSQSIDKNLVKQIIEIIDQSFSSLGLAKPKIAVCGLNPHAGEDGLLGCEDQEQVQPAIEELWLDGILAYGPFPSDSLFTKDKRQIYDVFLAMYHDQGLPVVKAIGFGQCVNVTLGLPYIRTSVDHGTALDIAAERVASVDSLEYATNYAIQLIAGQLPE